MKLLLLLLFLLILLPICHGSEDDEKAMDNHARLREALEWSLNPDFDEEGGYDEEGEPMDENKIIEESYKSSLRFTEHTKVLLDLLQPGNDYDLEKMKQVIKRTYEEHYGMKMSPELLDDTWEHSDTDESLKDKEDSAQPDGKEAKEEHYATKGSSVLLEAVKAEQAAAGPDDIESGHSKAEIPKTDSILLESIQTEEETVAKTQVGDKASESDVPEAIKLTSDVPNWLDEEMKKPANEITFESKPPRPPHDLPELKKTKFIVPNEHQLATIEHAKKHGNPFKKLNKFEPKTAVGFLRAICTLPTDAFFDSLVKNGFLSILVEALKSFDDPMHQLNAAIALQNIGTSRKENARAIVKAGAIKPLMKCLRSKDLSVASTAADVLGNIMTADDLKLGVPCYKAGVPETVLDVIEEALEIDDDEHQVFLKSVSRTLFTVALSGPPEFYDQDTSRLLEVIKKLIEHEDPEIASNAIWAFYCHRGAYKIGSDIVPLLFRLLKHPNKYISFATLSALANVAGLDAITTEDENRPDSSIVINATMVAEVLSLYDETDEDMIKKLFNFFHLYAKEEESRRQIAYDSGILELIVKHLDDEREKIQEVAILALTSLGHSTTFRNFQILIDTPNLLRKLSICLEASPDTIASQAVELMFNMILHGGKKRKDAIQTLAQFGTLNRLKKVLNKGMEQSSNYIAKTLIRVFQMEKDADTRAIKEYMFTRLQKASQF